MYFILVKVFLKVIKFWKWFILLFLFIFIKCEFCFGIFWFFNFIDEWIFLFCFLEIWFKIFFLMFCVFLDMILCKFVILFLRKFLICRIWWVNLFIVIILDWLFIEVFLYLEIEGVFENNIEIIEIFFILNEFFIKRYLRVKYILYLFWFRFI